ncbi:MAG TPA: aminotransferase class III-fold pyridoxal phosphate-dependent enzyme [Gemmatimonadales bacterium]|nr:aminotransferase class III-fold pyridoxal phosphate-dependent enzyme [Gemmatimonadales bacterium]
MPFATAWDRPDLEPAEARSIAATLFGLDGRVEELPSERDRNFRLSLPAGEQVVLKVAHAGESGAILALQHRVLERLADRAPGLAVPRVCRSLAGSDVVETVLAGGGRHLVRMLTWVPGTVLAECPLQTPELLRSLGLMLGRLDAALDGLSDPAAGRELKWDLTRALWVRDHVGAVEGPDRRALVTRHLDRFETEILPALGALRRGVIHNDANDWNVIVSDGPPPDRRVAGILDFGDLVEGPLVAELAIGAAYALLGKPDPLAALAEVVAGYHQALSLTETELALVFPLVCTRLSVSVVNAAYQRTLHPDNEYLAISEAPAWEALERLEAIHPRLAHYTLRAAAGLEPCPASPAVRQWLSASRPGPVLDLPGQTSHHVLDLSIGSPLIEALDEPDDMARFSAKLFSRLADAGATVGVGRYDEARALYVGPLYEALGNDRPVPRTVHLGIDLFVPAGVAVLAPLDGIVEAVRDNAGFRDYGPTIILRHEPEEGVRFWTLYGHLGHDALGERRPGEAVRRGDRLGTVGDLDVNGGWPPHPHVQIILDLLDRDGEFPGVARSDQRPVWLSLCPDPNLLLRIPEECFPAPAPRGPAILERRRARLGPSLSISYRRPLTMVRGWKQWLYDEDGLAWLDAVNNVPHVGHSHPAVVRAARDQLAVLNTNTRYLHPKLVEYAEQLVALLPAPLEVCYFVNSGSEANELAIRLARAATGRRGMVVVDVGYHGNTTTLVDVSPYKHDGPGGRGAPRWVRKIPMPDGYRGEWKRTDPDAGRKYAAAVTDAIAALAASGEPAAAFLAESILSCGGQVVLPDGFLAEAYRRAREAGAVTIADEVQVGFGRVGTHWWAFETQQVVPDIVTMGKPIGNGFPLGAVVTTRPIAEAFANGMEYFSTFGGGPVASAVGMAVLEVMRSEGLRDQALDVGGYLLEGLRGLVDRHALVGDARGLGLFSGIELVRDRTTLEPAGGEASWVANRVCELGVLVSTDGPFHNVIKIKPPLCFTRPDADRLVAALDRALTELG